MKCAEFLQELTNYLDGVLDDRTKAELEDHLAWCHNCYVVCDTTKKTIRVFKGMDPVPIPTEMESRLMAAVERKMADKKMAVRKK